MISPHVFQVPEQVTRDQVVEVIADFGAVKKGEAFRFEDHYFDSFDWRLYDHGFALLQRGSEVMLRYLNSDAVVLHAAVAGRPKFFWDFPAGDLRDQLAALLDVRVLLPLAQLTLERFPYRVCDSNGKSLFRLEWEALSDGDREDVPLQRLRLFVFRGYEAVAQRVCKKLMALGCELVQAEGEALVAVAQSNTDDFALQVMKLHGHQPGAYSSKPKWELRADMTAATAAGTIFLKLADVIEINEQGIRDDLDIECLHDFRVATRKTRAGLSQLKQVFDPETLDHYKVKFRALGHMTNRMRDLDVYLCDADHYREMLPDSQQSALEAFFTHLRDTRTTALSQLKRDLDAFGLKAFLAEWRASWLREESAMGIHARKRVGNLAAKLILKRYHRILVDGRLISLKTPDQELHDLRIQCKKLRYMLEFFASLMSDKALRYLVKQLKGLQDVLGKFNDYYVQQETLKAYAARLGKTKAERETVFAVGVLVGKLHEKQREVRTHFKEAFDHFASELVQSQFDTVCQEAREVRA